MHGAGNADSPVTALTFFRDRNTVIPDSKSFCPDFTGDPMPKPHKPGPRLVLQEGVWTWLAARNRHFQRPPDETINYSGIARASHCSVSYLTRVRDGDLPLTLELVAGLVKASGMHKTPALRMQALAQILDWQDETADVDERELAAVA